MNKNDWVTFCEEGRTWKIFPDRQLMDSDRTIAQFRIVGVYSRRFSFEEMQDAKSFYKSIFNKWIQTGYASDFAQAWNRGRYYDFLLEELGLTFQQFQEE